MSISKLALGAALLWSHPAAAAFIDIDVGESGITFSPASATANVGDKLAFHFYPANHSVIQGDFTNGCQPSSGGFYSGFMPTSSGEAANIFVVDVTSTDPIFFYCGAPGHCKNGMCGVINPTSGQSLAAYMTACKGSTSVGIPAAVGGGTVEAGSEESSAPPSSSTTVATTTTTAAASSSATTTTTASQASSSTASSASSGPSSSLVSVKASSSQAGASTGPTATETLTASQVGTTVTTPSTSATASLVPVSGGKGRYDEMKWAIGFQAAAAVAAFILFNV